MLNGVWLFAMPWTVACQAPLSMEFSRQDTRVGCHFLFQPVLRWPVKIGWNRIRISLGILYWCPIEEKNSDLQTRQKAYKEIVKERDKRQTDWHILTPSWYPSEADATACKVLTEQNCILFLCQLLEDTGWGVIYNRQVNTKACAPKITTVQDTGTLRAKNSKVTRNFFSSRCFFYKTF